jgi:hypothetical protein
MRAEALQAPAAVVRLHAADEALLQAPARSLRDTPPQTLPTVARGLGPDQRSGGVGTCAGG